ncbi:MAG: hypothetical protein QXO00_02610 [Candidatus Bathyarchaeia archaeon]
MSTNLKAPNSSGEKIRHQRIHELVNLIKDNQNITVPILEGWVALRWGIREETLHAMLRQLVKAGMIEINSNRIKWIGKPKLTEEETTKDGEG